MLSADHDAATVLALYDDDDDATPKMSYLIDQSVTVATRTCQGSAARPAR
jgi:hypothetical protein